MVGRMMLVHVGRGMILVIPAVGMAVDVPVGNVLRIGKAPIEVAPRD